MSVELGLRMEFVTQTKWGGLSVKFKRNKMFQVVKLFMGESGVDVRSSVGLQSFLLLLLFF